MQRMEEVLTPRELNLARSYLGIGQPDEAGMTFQELAIYLNYNGPSGAEKAYKSALRKLKKELVRRRLRSVALRAECHPRRGAAHRAAPRGHGYEAPGDHRSAGAAPPHRPVEVSPSIEKDAKLSGRR